MQGTVMGTAYIITTMSGAKKGLAIRSLTEHLGLRQSLKSDCRLPSQDLLFLKENVVGPNKLKVEQLFNICQDDLLTKNIWLLDSHAEVCVWVGQSVGVREKQSAFEIAQMHWNSFQKKITLLFGAGHGHAAEVLGHALKCVRCCRTTWQEKYI